MQRIELTSSEVGELAPLPPRKPTIPRYGAELSAESRRRPDGLEPVGGPASSQEYSLYVPLHYEPGYAYPLIVWLHDNGLNETDGLDMVSRLSLRNYIAVGPRGTEQCVAGGYAWIQSEGSIAATEQAVFAAIDGACAQLNVHRQRVFIVGAGQGGSMAFRLAFRHPELFAAVVSLNGPLPDGSAPLARLKDCRHMPILWTQNAGHHLFSNGVLAEQLTLLYTAGFDLTLRQYPEPEPAWPVILPDVNRWIMERLSDSVIV